MSILVSVPTEAGPSLIVEVDEESLGGSVPVGRADQVVAEAGKTLEAAVREIVPSAQALLDQLKAVETPKTIEISFGLKISVEAGAIIAKTAGEANFGIKLTWEGD